MNKPKEKEENTKEKIQCYKCKGFEHVMYECPTKDKDQDLKEKVLQYTMKSDDEGRDDYQGEFCFVTM